MKIIFTLALFLALFTSKAQQTFQQVIYKNDLSKEYSGGNIVPALDGGFIFSGANNIKENDITVYNVTNLGKFSNAGTLEWMRTISKQIISDPHPLQMPDGSIFIGGSWSSNKLALIKTDALGNTVWAKNYSLNNMLTFANSVGNIIRSKDGNIIILSTHSPEGIGITKIDPLSGVVLVDKHYTTSVLVRANNIYETRDNGFIIVGQGNIVLKTDANFNLEWYKKIYAHTPVANEIMEAEAVTELQDGSFAISGWDFNTVQARRRGDIIKISSIGDAIWHKQFSSDLDNYFHDITKNQDTSVTVVGSVNSYYDVFPSYSYGSILNVSNDGMTRWSNFIGGQKITVFKSVIKSAVKSFIAAGTTTSFGRGKGAFFVNQFNSKGNTCSNKKNNTYAVTDIADSIADQGIAFIRNYTTQVLVEDIASSVITNTLITPVVQSTCEKAANSTLNDKVAIKGESGLNINILGNPVINGMLQLKVYSPVTQKMQVTISNTAGGIFLQQAVNLTSGNNTLFLPLTAATNGIYFLKLRTNKEEEVIRFIKAG